jgi:hypothetical protein
VLEPCEERFEAWSLMSGLLARRSMGKGTARVAWRGGSWESSSVRVVESATASLWGSISGRSKWGWRKLIFWVVKLPERIRNIFGGMAGETEDRAEDGTGSGVPIGGTIGAAKGGAIGGAALVGY